MLTLTKEEHDDYVDITKMQLMKAGEDSIKKMHGGCDAEKMNQFRNLNSLLYALEFYKTDSFTGEGIFNVQTSDDIIKTYSNTKQLRYGL